MSGSTRTSAGGSPDLDQDQDQSGEPQAVGNQAGRRRAGLVALLFAAVSFAITVAAVSGWFDWLDQSVLEWVRATRTDSGTSVMLLVSLLSSEYASPVVIAVCTLALAVRNRAFARYFFVMVATSTLWQIALKHFLERPRPQPPLVPYWVGAGYPSGHSLTALCIALGWLLWLRLDKAWVKLDGARLAAVRTAIMAWPLVVGFSRIYIDAHWASDVLGAFAIGLMHYHGSLFVAGRSLARSFRPPRQRLP